MIPRPSFLLPLYAAWRRAVARSPEARCLGMVSLTLTELLVIAAVAGLLDSKFWYILAAKTLPIPIAFFLALNLLERESPVKTRFSAGFYLLNIAGFGAASWLVRAPLWADVAATVGGVAGIFALVAPEDFLRRLWHHPRVAALSLAIASVSWSYYVLKRLLWKRLSNATGHVVQAGLEAAGLDTLIYSTARAISVQSAHFKINIHAPCSGLEGIFLFFFLLSVIALLDWRLFKRINLPEIYLTGFLYMFLINALRIAALFLLGHWAWNPQGGALAASARGMPLEMFHSWMGWVLYLIAFGAFMAFLYPRIVRRANARA